MLIYVCLDCSISHIAREVGCEDDSTFYRNFLRITGIRQDRLTKKRQSFDCLFFL